MKVSPIIALSCALACESTRAQTDSIEVLPGFGLTFPLPATVEGTMPSVPIRPDAIREFFRSLKELAVTPDPARLKSLYWLEPGERVVAESMVHMQRVLADSPSFVLKEFARLPEKRRRFWQQQVGYLTSHRASAVLLVISRNGFVEAMLPLLISEDEVRIVPPDHRHRHD